MNDKYKTIRITDLSNDIEGLRIELTSHKTTNNNNNMKLTNIEDIYS
jgi:hypothetical protein